VYLLVGCYSLLSTHVLWLSILWSRLVVCSASHSVVWRPPCILANFTGGDFNFFYYISKLFVHIQIGIQGKSQVFEVVVFADLFIIWVRESGLGYPGSLTPTCFVGGSFLKNNNLAFSCPIIYFCSIILSPVLGYRDHFVEFLCAVSAET